MTTAPTLQTNHLVLRHHMRDDLPPLFDLLASERSRYMDGPFTKRDSWLLIASETGSWSLKGFGSWAITHRQTGECLGQIGINQPTHFPEAKLGWMLVEKAEGKGFAFEAAKTVLSWAKTHLSLTSLVSYIDPQNKRSFALAQKLGAEKDISAPRPDGESETTTWVLRYHLMGRKNP